jgi:hypothetical protein
MVKNLWIAWIVLSACGLSPLYAVVLGFEDLTQSQSISETLYAGLFWEKGNAGYNGNEGFWSADSGVNHYPHSGDRNLINRWGCTQLGIQFPQPVTVLGAYIAGQGTSNNWTTGIRVHGYANHVEIATTDWFQDIDTHPDWFAVNFFKVDRIVFESIPVSSGGGWYGLDDLTYEIPEPTTLSLLALGGMLAWRKRI